MGEDKKFLEADVKSFTGVFLTSHLESERTSPDQVLRRKTQLRHIRSRMREYSETQNVDFVIFGGDTNTRTNERQDVLETDTEHRKEMEIHDTYEDFVSTKSQLEKKVLEETYRHEAWHTLGLKVRFNFRFDLLLFLSNYSNHMTVKNFETIGDISYPRDLKNFISDHKLLYSEHLVSRSS